MSKKFALWYFVVAAAGLLAALTAWAIPVLDALRTLASAPGGTVPQPMPLALTGIGLIALGAFLHHQAASKGRFAE